MLVNTVAGLTSALSNTAVGHMVLAPGTYFISGQLSVTRSVVIEAMVAGSVVLDGGNAFRVLYVNPGLSGVVQLIGLNITRGRVSNDVSAPIGPRENATRNHPGHSPCVITPSPRWEKC